MKRFWLILAAFSGLAMTAAPASADVQWTLNQGGSLGPNNVTYGTVIAKQKGTGTSQYVEVTITLAGNNYFIASGSHSGIAWDMSVTPDTITAASIVSGNASAFTPRPLNGSYDDQPFTSGANGNFNFAITPVAGSGGAGTEQTITFDLTKSGVGLALTNIVGHLNTLFTPNNGGYFWAVDIGLNCSGSPGSLSCAGGTGVVAAKGDPTIFVPEPGSWTMSFAGLAGLSALMMVRRRRKQARA
jgi:hypothetical protein